MSQITCTNTLGSYTCTCSTAGHVVISGSNGVFTTSTVGSLVCGDVDECATNNHECCADNCSCNNEAPGYTCSCNTGYVADGLYNCVDENECDTPNKCGSDANSICTNTDGSYLCECNDPGFTFNTGGQTCDNIDECTDNTHNCCTHTGCSACVDDDPGFTCGCDAGYTGDGTSCADVDECDDGSHDCGDTAGAMSCVNNVGTFDCVCDSGYTFENNAGVKSCVQIDECDDGSHECCAVGCICSDLPGSYECTCDSGYETDGTDFNCVNINECDTADQCGTDAQLVCTDLEPFFSCDCNPGWTMNVDGGGTNTCVNDDECTDNTHNCCTHAGCSACVDAEPGFTCGCESGYTGDGTSCADVDECDDGSHDCGDTAGAMSCNNLVGSFECVCDSGYTFENNAGVKSCVQIDECDDVRKLMRQLVCTDLEPFFSCDCNPGWTMNIDGGGTNTCVNDDECTLNTHNCCTHAGCSACVDAEPGFICDCDVGYRGDGTSCVDIDECAEDTVVNVCGAHALLSCTNTIGSYECSCIDGYNMIFTTEQDCVQVDECTDGLHDCVTDATGICNDFDPNVDGIKYECGCVEGYYGTGFANGQGCIELVDECDVGTHNCDVNADCFNTQAAFTCTCHAGFTDDNNDGTVCTNIDECTDGLHNCSDAAVGGICTDNPGSFVCSCDDAISYDEFGDGLSCILKVDECADNTHSCDTDATCTDTIEAFECACNAGYDGPGWFCYNVDECKEKGADIFGEAGVPQGTPFNYADFVAQLDTKAGFKNQPNFSGALEDEFVLEASFMIGNTGNMDKYLFALLGQENQFIPNLPVDERDFFDVFEVKQDACVDPVEGASGSCFLSLTFDTLGALADTTTLDSISVQYDMNNTCADYDAVDGCPVEGFLTISRERFVDGNGDISYTMLMLFNLAGVETQAITTHNGDHRMTEFQFVKTDQPAALMTSFFINQAGTHFDNDVETPGTDCVLLVDECTVGGHNCHPTGGVCTDLDDGWSCACAATHFDLDLDNPGIQCDSLLPCDARLIGDVFDDSALSPRGFWDCNRGNKKTVCNYICPVSESVGVSTSCKIKSGGQNWSNPTRELTCNLPAECDIDALTAEAADFLSRIGSTYTFNANDWQIDGLQEPDFLRGRWNCGNSFFTKKINFSCKRKEGGTRAVWKFKGNPDDAAEVCTGIFRNEGFNVRAKYLKEG
ncbi:unnamed protein product [Oikopleura dioica]|uniref:EGF-like domain-containing protein n=1 Tax=Oikopleura dioica TaxID=34765 RepID=E4YJL4_OIKDI|nr:unnamed protein product [Oikopleura dioica]